MVNKVIKFFEDNKFYTYTFSLFIMWMAFVDNNDFGSILNLKKKIVSLKEEIAFYDQKIIEVKKEREEVFGSPKLQEKFAREQYYMQKADEEVFVLTNEKDEPLEK